MSASGVSLLLLAILGQPPVATPGMLTVEDCFALEDEIRPDHPSIEGWLDGRTFVIQEERPVDGAEKARVWLKVDADRGEETPLFSADAMTDALAALPGVDREQARSWSRRSSYVFSDAMDAVLWNDRGDLFHYRFGGAARRLTRDPHEEVGETLSPDGTMAAYLRDANLHVVGTDGSPPRALTSEGGGDTLLGRLDWVYQEELYGRGNWQGYWWSPDSKRIAFLALDESPVPAYTIVDHRETRPDVEVWRYPKAGDPNPRVRVGVVDAAGGDVRWVDLSAYEREEFLVVRVGWTPDSKEVVVQVQNRVQTWLDVVFADAATGDTRRLFRDETGVWVEPTDAPFFTDDGRFVWLSERSGFRHLYLYDRDGGLVTPITGGRWEVDVVHGIDAEGTVWFSGDAGDVKGRRLYRVKLDGTGLGVVTEARGTHRVDMSTDHSRFVDSFSSITDPGRITVHQGDGELVRTLAEGSTRPLEPYDLSSPELFTVETRDGFPMEAMMIKPAGYVPGERYPVFSYIYGGPHAPQVLDRFFNRNILWHHMLAQKGYLIWVLDNRSASGRGLESVKGIYQNMGAQELADVEDGLDWLVAEGYADPERIGLWGWSYGGYMTAYALTHSDRFKVGISGAPVTDWRFYDSIYTERYMHLPQVNRAGYASSSVVGAAGDLRGQLLIIHGTIDENVHMQNTFQLAHALQAAGKPFDLMVYPGNRHGVRDPKQRLHLYRMMADYVLEHL